MAPPPAPAKLPCSICRAFFYARGKPAARLGPDSLAL
jgi:hypothetical protein